MRVCRCSSAVREIPVRWTKSKTAKARDRSNSMKGAYSAWAWLLLCSIVSTPVMAGSKSVAMVLRVLVDAPPPCT
ncbi:fimbrial protein, partial [Escherichia coli]